MLVPSTHPQPDYMGLVFNVIQKVHKALFLQEFPSLCLLLLLQGKVQLVSWFADMTVLNLRSLHLLSVLVTFGILLEVRFVYVCHHDNWISVI